MQDEFLQLMLPLVSATIRSAAEGELAAQLPLLPWTPKRQNSSGASTKGVNKISPT